MSQPFTVARKYHAISLVGRGGMGAVYDAVHQTTGRRVALKLLREDHLQSSRAVERFLREARIVGGLSSPNLAGVLDAGTDEDSGIPYLAMEFLEGCDLKWLLSQRGKLPPGLSLCIAAQVCHGLAAAHAAGIVHRDVKPANVRLTAGPDGALLVKVFDFGVAKDVAEEHSLTATGDVVGSLAYMAPEQFSHGSVDFRADLWAVGILLFECLAGSAPLSNGALVSLGMLAVSNPQLAIPDIRSREPNTPAPVAELLQRAMAVHPNQRFASALEMAAAIANLLPHDARVLFADLQEGGHIPFPPAALPSGAGAAPAVWSNTMSDASWRKLEGVRSGKRFVMGATLAALILAIVAAGIWRVGGSSAGAGAVADETRPTPPAPASSAPAASVASVASQEEPPPPPPLESAAPAPARTTVPTARPVKPQGANPTPKAGSRDRM